jgi:glycosyltransferase involved in cell wall biosynthesis
MADPKPKICLNMIVKDESTVLGRLFASVRDYIDYYVIVDTGSSDGTQVFIREWMDAAGIEGEVHELPWVNFGHNRQQAMELAVAAARSDWLLFIDADEELGVSDPQFLQKMQKGVSYQLEKHHGAIRYALPNLVDISENRWQWKGPVHEYLEHQGGNNRREVRKDVWIVYHEGEGVRSRGLTAEQKFLRDARLLERELRTQPQDARSQFYLAQSYRHAGHHEKAYKAYRKRAAMRGWDEEKFMAQLEVARVAILLGKTEQVVLEEFLKAFDSRPHRAEPLHDLARYFREKKKYGRAYVFAKSGTLIPRPNDRLFVGEEIYAWRLLDELAVAAYWTGRFEESKTCCEEIVRRVDSGVRLSSDDIKRVQKNLAFANAKLDELAVDSSRAENSA